MLSTMSSRSTKGASKQRRENINNEIAVIRDLLPIQEQVRSRLSQLQVMSLCKAYIGKSNLLNSMQDSMTEDFHPFDFTQAISGFMIITDLKGRIFYVSDNVTDYLAHSMVDVVTQAETIYELVHNLDQQVFRTIYSFGDQSSLAEDSTFAFTCRMGMLRHPRRNPNFDRYKKMRIFGRKMVANELSKRAYFVALCTPCLNPMMASDPSFVFDTMIFKSVHTLDMKFVSIDHNGEHHLGYAKEELSSRSWYEMIHPDDIELAVNKHKELIQQVALEATCSLCLRVQLKSGEMLCLQLIMKKENNTELGPSEARIVCWNQVICPNEMGMDDKEELLHQMNTINYLEHYCSSQSPDKKIFYNASGGVGVAKEKKCDRSELMEKLKRKMQKAETEKTMKMPRMEKPVDGGLKISTPFDCLELLPERRPLTAFNGQNGGLLFDLSSRVGLNNKSPMNTGDQLMQSNPVTIDSSLDVFSQASEAHNSSSSSPNYFNFSSNIVTMPTPERQQTWSPAPGSYCLATSPASDDPNSQTLFPDNQEQEVQLLLGEKRFAIPELNPNEVDEFFEMEASASLSGVKDEALGQSSVVFDQLEGCTLFSEQFTQSFLMQLTAMAY